MTRNLCLSLCFLTIGVLGYRNPSQQPSVSMNPMISRKNYSGSNGAPKTIPVNTQGLMGVLPAFNLVDDMPIIKKVINANYSTMEVGAGGPVYTMPHANANSAADFYQSDYEQSAPAHHHHQEAQQVQQQPHYHAAQQPQMPVQAPAHQHGLQYGAYQPPAQMPAQASAPLGLNQNLTMEQIVSYLFGSYGSTLGNTFHKEGQNTMTRCKTYCNALPADPTCDSANTLYRNSCEAKCIQRTVTKTNLRYGMCCCSSDDFDYINQVKFMHNKGNREKRNMCLTSCIYNCLGADREIEDEHQEVGLKIRLKKKNKENKCHDLD